MQNCDAEQYRQAVQAPPGARCLFCGRDVAGSLLRKCVYISDPVPYAPQRIRYAGYGWVCEEYGKCVFCSRVRFLKSSLRDMV